MRLRITIALGLALLLRAASCFGAAWNLYNDTSCTITLATGYGSTCGSGSCFFSSGYVLTPGSTVNLDPAALGCSMVSVWTAGFVYGPLCLFGPGTYNASAIGDPACGHVVTTNTCVFSIRNNSTVTHYYQLMIGATPLQGSYGQLGTHSACIPGHSIQLQVITTNNCSAYSIKDFVGAQPDSASVGGGGSYFDDRSDNTGSSSILSTNSYGVSSIGGTPDAPLITGPPSAIYSNPASWGSNGPISFTTNAVAGDNINTLQTGFGAIYSALSQGFSALDSDLHGIDARLARLNTNGFDISALTNGFAGSNYMIGGGSFGQGTNWNETIARTSLGTAAGDADTLATSFGSAPTVGGGSPSALTFAFAGAPGGSLNIDPASVMPGLPATFKAAFSFAAVFGFAIFAGRRYWEGVKVFATASTGGVPDLNVMAATFGGNAFGLGVALVVPIILVAGWGVLLHVVINWFLTHVAGLNGIDPFGGMGGAGLYLINEFFNVSLILTLAWLQLTLYFGMGKLVLIAAAVSKFLFGK